MRQKTTISLLSLLLPVAMSAQDVQLPKQRPHDRAAVQQVRLHSVERQGLGLSPVSVLPLGMTHGMKAPQAGDEVEVLYEDFSKFTLGSESEPEATSLTGDGADLIPDEYTLQPGWSGDGVYQAGGVAYLGLASDGYPGFLNTPLMDLSADGGNARLTFRLNLAEGVASDYLYIGWSNADEPGGDYMFIDVTAGWQDYEVQLEGCSAATQIQFYTYNNFCFIDDIRILQEEGLSTPVAYEPDDYDGSSFTASWSEVGGATSYLLNVFTLDSSLPSEVVETFDGIVPASDGKFIDDAQSTNSEYFEYDVSTNGTSREIYTTSGNYYSPGVSLAFDASGDYVQTVNMPADITSLMFWVKPQGASGESKIIVSAFYDGSWMDVAELTYEQMDADGGFVNLSGITSGIRQFRLTYSKDVGNVAIDDLTIGLAESEERDYFIERQEVTGTSCRVEGLDPSQTYYYTVIAKNSDIESSESAPVEVALTADALGIPMMLPATDVTGTGFTANWEAVENANYYSFYTYLAHVATAAERFYILDTDFAGISGGTLDNPSMDYMYTYLDEYLDRADWYVEMPLFADGVLGVTNLYSDFGYYGILMSPQLDLSAGGGRVNVDMTVMGTDISSLTVQLVGYDGGNEVLLDSEQMAVGPDFTRLSCTLEGATDYCYISIYGDTGSGNLFFDDLSIWLDLSAGEVVEVPYYYTETTGTSTYVPIATVNDGDMFAYCAAALLLDDEGNVMVAGDYSDFMVVDVPGGVDRHSADGRAAYVTDGVLTVDNPMAEAVSVHGADGVCIYSARQAGTHLTMELPRAGVYVVKVGDAVFKVMC